MVGDVVSTVYGPMSAEFAKSPLGDLCVPDGGVQTGPFGSQLHSSDYVECGTPIITVEHLGENRIIHKNLPRVTDEDKKRLERYTLITGDIVFSRVGSVDRRAIVHPEEDGWLFSGRCLRVRPDRKKIDPGFLSWFFGLPTFQEHIRQIAVGATMPSLNTKILGDVAIYYPPPLKHQQAIACILGALDDKIELNRRMNRTLEDIAQAIFKSWFVDFDPVRAKAAGQQPPNLKVEVAALFPSSFKESALGEIPTGWRTGVADDLAAFVLGGDWGKDAASSEFAQAAFCIRGADIPSLQSGGVGNMPIRYLKPSSIEKRSLRPYDIVIEISRGSPTQSTGRPVFVSLPLLEQLRYPLVCSNFCRLYRPKRGLSHFVYLWLRWLYSSDQFLQYENGTTGIKNFAFTSFCQRHEVTEPTPEVLSAFNTIVDPLLESIGRRGRESATLAWLRDALLPALIGGDLVIADAERIVGRAL